MVGLSVSLMFSTLLISSDAGASGAGALSGGPAHHRAAIAVAAQLRADVMTPKGAQESATPPKGSGSSLGRPVQMPATPNLVDDKAFYVVKGQAPAVLKWFESHKPTGSRLSGTGVEGQSGKPYLWLAEFDWAGVHNVLFSEDVVIGVVRLPRAATAIRIDSQVTWLPGRSPLDTVPAGAREVRVLVAVPSAKGGPGRLLEPTISTRDAGTISQITSDVNYLQVLLPGAYPCPPGPDLDIFVEFQAHVKAAPEAVTTAYPYGCAFVNNEVHGQTSPQILVDGGTLASQLTALVGLKLPPVPPGEHSG